MMVTNCFSGMVALRTARSCIFRRDIVEEAHYSDHPTRQGRNQSKIAETAIHSATNNFEESFFKSFLFSVVIKFLKFFL